MKDSEHLQWIHDRIVEVYGESRDIDFLIRFRKIIKQTEDQEDNFEAYMKFRAMRSNEDLHKQHGDGVPENQDIGGKTRDWKDVVLEGEPKLGVDEEWATKYKARAGGVHQPVVDNTSTPPTKKPVYQDPKTGKLDTLFNEETLIPTWTVRYEDPTRGNKGEAVYMTVSAKDEWEAKTKALACGEFTKHLTPEFWELKYLTAYKAEGNYVIGKVKYFEGDPRL